MGKKERKWLFACGALAAGEGLASLVPTAAESWPLFLVLLALVTLFGYGFALRGWRWAALAALGAALFLQASVAEERAYRETPWLRGVSRRGDRGAPPSPVRRELSRRVGLGLSHDREAAALNRAILLGERARIPYAARRAFVESGTIHVFAISGLHVMVVARTLMFLVALLFVPVRFQGVLTLPLVWGYVVLIGAPPSAVRAALTATFYLTAPLCWRRPDGLRAWSLAFLLVHLLCPRQITDVGSLLSFAVMLALVLAGRVADAFRTAPARAFFLTAVAWAAGVPIAAMAFGRLTPGGLLANLILLPAAGVTVSAGTAGVLASFVSMRLAVHLNNLAALTTGAMALLARVVARLPLSNFEIERWGLVEAAEWYLALGLVFFLVHRRKARLEGVP